MASTNKTTNYELSQFIGTDKPAWLSDYNSDMSKIDAGIHTAQTTATGADGKADSNATSIGTLANLTTTAKTDLVSSINEVDSDVTTAQSTANTANTTASGCRTDLNKFNLSNKSFLSPTTNVGVVDSLTAMQLAVDTSNSIYKLYGRIKVTNLSGITGNLSIKIGDTSLRPASSYQINSGVIIVLQNANNELISVGTRNIKINTDGTAYVVGDLQNPDYALTLPGGTGSIDCILSPCLYFNSDFGDI